MRRGTFLAFPVLGLGLLILAGCDMSVGGMVADSPSRAAAQSAPKPSGMKVVPETRDAFFQETGQILGEPFLSYWQQHGGVAVFGYPISQRLLESSDGNGEVYTVKYFERARLELHPSTGAMVTLGRLGSILHRTERAATALPGARYFPETGHNLSGSFLSFWSAHGGLEIFGYPITEVRDEWSPTSGKMLKVQYFERSKFELHPEFAGTPSEVQLGLLGLQVYQQTYGGR